jgi:TonB family protein
MLVPRGIPGYSAADKGVIVRRVLFAATAVTMCSLSLRPSLADGELSGLGKIHWTLAPLGAKLASQDGALRSVIQERLNAAGIPVDDSAASRLEVKIEHGSQTHIALTVSELVPLPNNASVKKDVTVWSKETDCPSKRLTDELTNVLNSFAIQYLKDNRASSSAFTADGKPDSHSVSTGSAASNSDAASKTDAATSANSPPASEPTPTASAASSVTSATSAVPPSSAQTASSTSRTESKTTAKLDESAALSKPSAATSADDIKSKIVSRYSGVENTTDNVCKVCFCVDKDGSMKWTEVFNSCGNKVIDNAVQNAVDCKENFAPHQKSIALNAVLRPHSKTLVFEPYPKIDWGSYMAKLQDDIKTNWYPRKDTKTKRAKVLFKVWKNGKVSDLHFEKPTEDSEFDGAAMAAIYNTTPSHYPENGPDSVSIEFTFDYNVWERDKKGKSQLVTTSKPGTSGNTTAKRNPDEFGGKLDKLDTSTLQIPPSTAVATGNREECMRMNNEGVKALNASDFTTAVRRFESALKADPHYRLARINLAVALNNFGLLYRSDPPTAANYFHYARYLDPNNKTTIENIDSIIMLMNKSPKSSDDRKAIGAKAESENDYVGEIVEYQAACNIKDDHALRVKIGDAFVKLKEPQLALEQYQLAKKLKGSPDVDAKITQINKASKTAKLANFAKPAKPDKSDKQAKPASK